MDEATRSITKQPVCAGLRRDGHGCGAPALAGDGWCYSHHPHRVEERTAARQRGGRNRATAARLRALLPPRLIPVYERLEGALGGVLDGTLDPRQATAAAAVARAMVAVLVSGELEARVRKLEGEVEE